MDKRTGKRYKNERKMIGADKSLDEMHEIFYHAKVAEGRAKRTLDMYNENYKKFCMFLDYAGVERSMSAITPELLRSYKAWLLNTARKWEGHPHKAERNMTIGLDPVTVNTKFKTLKTMFKFLEEEGYIDYDPSVKIQKTAEPQKQIKILEVEDIKRLLAAPDRRTYAGFRDYVIMNLLVDSLCRINEVLSLRKEDVDTVQGFIYVLETVAKSRRGRTVPIQKRTARLLAELMRECEDFESDYIFLTNYGGRLTDDRFRERLQQHANKVGVDVHIHPHLFRHTSATIFLENGGTERYLAEIMGHSDLRMVTRYTHLSKQDIKKKHDQFTPLNNVISGLQRERKR
ncbi:tyrosine-type recombinase/integrase [Paenibacillus motobuensis]|uniref:tyrosine-type recombinase/integrase n=1 Tax=Paenibacillus motobuensis TaxID=295324 RepID=UPI00363EAE24